MFAMILDEQREFCWQEVADPIPKDGEVLIRVYAASVNRADLMQKDGCYASPEGWPDWCGLEVSGRVLATGGNSCFVVGQAVCALVGGGGYSELVKVPASMVLPIPEGLSWTQAASLPEVWSTAYLNLVKEAGGMKSGDCFYMQAGASGVGLAAIQIAKIMGAKVITTVDSDRKADFVRSLGADIVLNYKVDDVLSVLRKNSPTVSLDCIGGNMMGEALNTMAFGGRWIMIATMGGARTEVNLEFVWRRRLKLIGSTLRSRSDQEKSEILHSLQKEYWPLFSSAKLLTHIHAVFPIKKVEEAHGVLRRCENIGKVVLTLGGDDDSAF